MFVWRAPPSTPYVIDIPVHLCEVWVQVLHANLGINSDVEDHSTKSVGVPLMQTLCKDVAPPGTLLHASSVALSIVVTYR